MYANTNPSAAVPRRKVTVPELRGRKSGGSEAARRIVMVTGYDYTMARLLDEAEVDMVLVGDSLGMVVQGRENTIPVTLDEMIYHCRSVARGLSYAHLVGDMPFMTYQTSPAQAVENAGRLMKEGACESVKLEGGADVAPQVEMIVRCGIPVVGHIGLTPQSVHALGGFKMQGRGERAAQRLMDDARAIEDAGAFALVLEAVPPDVAAEISAAVSIPTIGIGAGASCDGQVLVCTDLLGLSRGHRPRFVKPYASLGDAAVAAFREYADEVRSGAFPAEAHTFKPNGPAPEVPALRLVKP
ncbi:MAG: 3-methyl-2-oxobutanoate hydroxymethyltransferase [Polyangiaceae bacterium]